MSFVFNCRRLLKEDIDMPCKELAVYLLGKLIVRKLENGIVLKGRIVETESYLGGEDKASHSHNGRRTNRNEPMYMSVGTLYVYITYGMYYCLNISSQEPGAAVLLRALEPIDGIETMRQLRAKKSKHGKVLSKTSLLCNGPSKLCMAMDVSKDINKINVIASSNDEIWLEEDPEYSMKNNRIILTSRIGIPNASEWTLKPLRYYIMNNDCVSKKNKTVEKVVNTGRGD